MKSQHSMNVGDIQKLERVLDTALRDLVLQLQLSRDDSRSFDELTMYYFPQMVERLKFLREFHPSSKSTSNKNACTCPNKHT